MSVFLLFVRGVKSCFSYEGISLVSPGKLIKHYQLAYR